MEKKVYESLKQIKAKIASGQTTTFAERNWMKMQVKKQDKKAKRFQEYWDAFHRD